MPPTPPDVIRVPPVQRAFHAQPAIPASKSITNRALPLAALARGASTLRNVLLADDTRYMIGALQRLGFSLALDEAEKTIRVAGAGGDIPVRSGELFCGNSGTTIRFLAAILAASPGDYRLDGDERMRRRPLGELLAAIAALGGKARCLEREGYPPLALGAAAGWAGGTCRFTQTLSSQYISAILLAAPLARRPVRVVLAGPVTSEPYVRMTLAMMEHFGVRCPIEARNAAAPAPAPIGDCVIHVPVDQPYQPRDYRMEPDASNAGYFLAAAALIPGASVTIRGLGRNSLQGDVLFADVLYQMGAAMFMDTAMVRITGRDRLRGLTINMNAIPDMVQTLCVLALFADSPTRITGVGNLRVKETDRLAALQAELTKLGAQVETTQDAITVFPPPEVRPARIATYDDHRMAMAFALAGLRVPGVEIENPGCTAKTYPEFFTDFLAMTAAAR
jgi:3-phosphoshikimate 1-carboxyvinyltransferase